jgi:hypothetical protein
LPFEEVWENFQRKRVAWETSKQCGEIKSLLASAKLPPIQKVVAFACSSMTWDDEARHRCTVQHALILTIRDFLVRADRYGKPSNIKCYAQDPLYTKADTLVLQRENITVLDDPRGFLEIDEETVVLSHAPDIPVRQVTADITRPAMMIWNKVRNIPTPSPPAERPGIKDLGLQ